MTNQKLAGDKFILRFNRTGHRAELKRMAADQKRSLNAQILLLIEAGQRATGAASQTAAGAEA